MTDSPSPDRGTPSLRLVILVLGFACGAAVANLYYAQPLLALIAGSFSVSHGSAAVVVTATQVGYAAGLVLFLPLGDLVENRALTSRTLLLTAAALLAAAAAPGFGLFLAASVLVGFLSVVAQVLVPLAAHLAPPAQRGRVVGTVMSGLLLGILLARTASSLAAAAWGWRSIYVLSAVLMVGTSLALRRVLPPRRPAHTATYRELLASVGRLARSEPVLRALALRQACLFGAFTAFWTGVTFELTEHHAFGQVGIAVFALVGAAGAVAAPLAGRLGDRGHGHAASGAALGLAAVALVLAALGAASVVVLALAGVLLDLAVQSHLVLAQREMYSLSEDARARMNSVYMGTVFVGGALASALTAALVDSGGWTAVALAAAVLPVLGFGIWLVGPAGARAARDRRAAPASGPQSAPAPAPAPGPGPGPGARNLR